MGGEFWWFVTLACLVWYFGVTVYVGVRGALDIKSMLARLDASHASDEPAEG